MGTIKDFEDLRAWQSARKLTKSIYGISGTGKFARDFGLRDQIRRAAASVMLNIAEGFDAGSDPKFVQFLGYARRSASEVQAALYAALDQSYVSEEEFRAFYEQALSCKKQINALITYLHKPRRTD
jgi:four helix bundle protein